MSKRGTERRPSGSERRPGGSGQRRPSGSARKAAARRQQERRRRMTILWVVAGIVVVIAVVAVALVSRQPAKAGYDRVATFGSLSRNHTTGAVSYQQNPPVGGDHNPVWQNCGYYDQPIRNENGVHSLEHGAVWITYRPDLPKAQVDRLASIGREQTFVVVSPYPGLPAPVVGSAWGVQEWFRSADDARLTDFVGRYRQGPQTPEPGAACTGGTGVPK